MTTPRELCPPLSARCRAAIEVYEPGEGWTRLSTLQLDDEQRRIVGGWLAEDFTRRLAAQARPSDIALMTGAELWALPDDKLRAILEGEWRVVAYFALFPLVPEIYTAIEVRFGEQLTVEITADVLTYKGHDGETFRGLSRRERRDFLDRLNQRIARGPNCTDPTPTDK